MKTSTDTGELAKAMAMAQAEMRNPKFDATNPHFRNKFASLAAIRDAVIPLFSKHGIAVSQELISTPEGTACTTILMHESGQWAAYGPLIMPSQKDDAQGRGSAATYGKRYSLQSVAGVVGDEDDDGEAAQDRRIDPKATETKPTAKQLADAQSLADEIVRVLDGAGDDEAKAVACCALDLEMHENEVVGLAGWGLLNAQTRKLFKGYVKQGNR